MKRWIIFLSLAICILVSGCAIVPSFYQKTGVTEEQRKQDYKECSKEAHKKDMASYWSWSRQANPATGVVWFEGWINACMQEKGYGWIEEKW